MVPNEFLLSKGGGGGGCNGKSGEGFIDRSKVRILLCDNNVKSSEEVFTLLCKCSYQVTSVRSPRQVIDALNAEGPDIDIILSEVDLPMAKGLKMLKYIMRDKELQRIPVIMMSAQDEVSLVVKCLRLGAADYLVKPLRTNELLNLWTHMWRRRRMLGLAEKNILNHDFDLVASDPSDANTNSTTLFSDDTDENPRKSINPETCVSTRQGYETNAATAPGPVEIQPVDISEYRPQVPGTNDRQRGQILSGPRKSELKIGRSSAFFTYVKSSRSNTQGVAIAVDENAPRLLRIKKKFSSYGGPVDSPGVTPVDENASPLLRIEKKLSPSGGRAVNDTRGHVNTLALGNHSPGDDFPSSNSIHDYLSLDRSCTSPLPSEFSQQRNSKMEELPKAHMHQTNNSHNDVSFYNAHSAYRYYIPGVMNEVMMTSAASMYQMNLTDVQNDATALLPQYNHIPHCPPHMPWMASFPYHPGSVCLQTGQMPTMHPWPPYGSSSSNDGNLCKVDRREAALLKFRQKRKERCFDKKIRYVNRKRLAERRPRVRGQFVRKRNGINADLNGQPTSTDFDNDEEDDEEEEDQAATDSSPDNDSSVFQG